MSFLDIETGNEKQNRLAIKYQKTKDPAVLSELIRELMPMIKSAVTKYREAPIPDSALEAEAILLAKQAIETYDPNKQASIGTHVYNYLKKLYRFTSKYQNVGRIPEARVSLINTFKETHDRLRSELGREPLVDELAKELQIPVVGISQLSRAPEKGRAKPIPLLSDLRESGAIEQDADVVIFIYRPEIYKPDDESIKGIADIIIAKQRNGPTGRVSLAFLNKFARFSNREFHTSEE